MIYLLRTEFSYTLDMSACGLRDLGKVRINVVHDLSLLSMFLVTLK